jgi:DNA-binding MarR family transcriptional regulator
MNLDTGPSPVAVQPPGSGAKRDALVSELVQELRQLFRSVRRMRGRDTHLGGSDVSLAQFELIAELYERGELSASELAAAAQLAPATVTQMLDHLAAGGYVERARLERDRRVVVSRLTPSGAEKIEQKRAVWQARWEDALASVTEPELHVAVGVLRRLHRVFSLDRES